MDKAIWGSARWGYFRWGVYKPDWDNVALPRLKNVEASKIWSQILTSLKKAVGSDAIWGFSRWGYFRWGVYKADWDNKILPKLKNIPTSTRGGIDPAIQGVMRQGYWRQNVVYPIFDEVKEQLRKAE